MKMEETECSETSPYIIQTSWNYPEESIQHTEHSESLKSRKLLLHYNVNCIVMSVGMSKECTAVLKNDASFIDDISDCEHYRI